MREHLRKSNREVRKAMNEHMSNIVRSMDKWWIIGHIALILGIIVLIHTLLVLIGVLPKPF